MNEFVTITPNYSTPFLDAHDRSCAAHPLTQEKRERMREYHRKHYRGVFKPDARWTRCAGTGREELE